MRFYWPIAKVDAEQRMVWGYASTEAEDDQGETVTARGVGRGARRLHALRQYPRDAPDLGGRRRRGSRGRRRRAFISAPRSSICEPGRRSSRASTRVSRSAAGSPPATRRPQVDHRLLPDRNLGGRPPGQPRGGVRLLEAFERPDSRRQYGPYRGDNRHARADLGLRDSRSPSCHEGGGGELPRSA